MEFNHLLPILLALLCPLVLAEGSHASESPLAVLYWQSVLPNVPLPQTLQQLVFNSAGNKGNFLNGHQQAKVYPSTADVGSGSREIPVFDLLPRSFLWRRGNKGNFLNGHQQPKVYPSTADVGSGSRKIPVFDLLPRNFPSWRRGKSETTNYSNTTLFFLNTDLRSDKTFNVRFSDNIIDKIGFLPRQVADSIPFSTEKLPEIFNHFSINPKSIEAHYMKTTLEDCEAPKLNGEDKYCATSLESFVDFGVARFGKKVLVLSNEVEEEKNKVQKYKVLKGIKMAGGEQIVCHKEIYPYAVFYCHKFKDSEAYKVTLLSANGKKAKALVQCHKDTSAWNPNHMAFKLLNVKPGGATICHFLYSDTIVWIRN